MITGENKMEYADASPIMNKCKIDYPDYNKVPKENCITLCKARNHCAFGRERQRKPYCFSLPERSHIYARDPKKEKWCDSCECFVECQEAYTNRPKILTLNLKKRYFDDIKSGLKREEYREAKTYWINRLVGKSFDVIEVCNGYPEKGDVKNRLWFVYSGYERKVMNWDLDGAQYSGCSFVISLKERLDYPYQAQEPKI
jgi:hypothetical protein